MVSDISRNNTFRAFNFGYQLAMFPGSFNYAELIRIICSNTPVALYPLAESLCARFSDYVLCGILIILFHNSIHCQHTF